MMTFKVIIEDGRENKLLPLLKKIQKSQLLILKNQKEMADKFDPLIAEQRKTVTGIDSILLLLERTATLYEDAKDDPEQIQALVDEQREANEKIAAAVLAYTPTDEPEE